MKLTDVVDDETYDNLDWEYVERDKIPDLMEGYTVVGMEPSGYPPCLEGIILCLKSKEDEMFLLYICHNYEHAICGDRVMVHRVKLPEKTK